MTQEEIEKSVSLKADQYSNQFDNGFQEKAAEDYYQGAMDMIDEIKNGRLKVKINRNKEEILDIIYSVASGSIRGLPAISERRFKELRDAFLTWYNSQAKWK